MHYSDLGKDYTREDAISFSEGNQKLQELLFYCLDHKIKTFACCAGHFFENYDEFVEHHLSMPYFSLTREQLYENPLQIENYNSYIAFSIDNNSQNLIRFLLENPILNNKQTTITISKLTNKNDTSHIVALYAENKNAGSWQEFDKQADEFFEGITHILQQYNPNMFYQSAKYDLESKLNHLDYYGMEFKNNLLTELKLRATADVQFDNLDRLDFGKFTYYKNVSCKTSELLEGIQKENDLQACM